MARGYQSAYVRPEHQIHVHQINLNNQETGYDDGESAEDLGGAATGDIGRNGEDRGINMNGTHQFNVKGSGGSATDTRKGPGGDSNQIKDDEQDQPGGDLYHNTNIGTPVIMIPTNISGSRPGPAPG